MPLTKDSVRATKTSNNEECFVCDEAIPKGTIAVAVRFKIKIAFGAGLDVIKYMHPEKCADFLMEILEVKVKQSRKAL